MNARLGNPVQFDMGKFKVCPNFIIFTFDTIYLSRYPFQAFSLVL